MLSVKKLLKLAKKWQKLAAVRRKRISLPQSLVSTDVSSCSTSGKPGKGGFVVYSADRKRFQLPLEYLNNQIIRELFNMAEDEFGLPSEGAITLPCEAKLMEYAIALIKQQVNRDVERAFLTSIASSRCPSSFYLQHQSTLQIPVYSF